MLTISQVFSTYLPQLRSISETPQRDIEFFLMEILNVNRAYLLAFPDYSLTFTEYDILKNFIDRRKKLEPVAYILGHQPFWSLDFKVTAATLIPRPETEHLIEWILENANAYEKLCVLDLGTGSGAIALSLAIERPLWMIDATDISSEALDVAKINAAKYKINSVNFYLSSWYRDLKNKKYNIIVSNPPYINPTDSHLSALTFEPLNALIADKNGFSDLEAIINGASNHLIPGGYLIVEHGYEQSDLVKQQFDKCGFVDIVQHKDLAQLFRFVSGRFIGAS